MPLCRMGKILPTSDHSIPPAEMEPVSTSGSHGAKVPQDDVCRHLLSSFFLAFEGGCGKWSLCSLLIFTLPLPSYVGFTALWLAPHSRNQHRALVQRSKRYPPPSREQPRWSQDAKPDLPTAVSEPRGAVPELAVLTAVALGIDAAYIQSQRSLRLVATPYA